MTITKEIVIDKIEVLEDGQLQIREATRIMDDGVMIAETYHRSVCAPGDDTSALPERVRSVAAAVHTPAAVAAFRAKLAKAKGVTPT